MGTICIAALAGCAQSEHIAGYGKAEPSGFLKDYSKLHAAYWAKRFAWRACMMRVEFTCEMPEE